MWLSQCPLLSPGGMISRGQRQGKGVALPTFRRSLWVWGCAVSTPPECEQDSSSLKSWWESEGVGLRDCKRVQALQQRNSRFDFQAQNLGRV